MKADQNKTSSKDECTDEEEDDGAEQDKEESGDEQGIGTTKLRPRRTNLSYALDDQDEEAEEDQSNDDEEEDEDEDDDVDDEQEKDLGKLNNSEGSSSSENDSVVPSDKDGVGGDQNPAEPVPLRSNGMSARLNWEKIDPPVPASCRKCGTPHPTG